MQIKFIGDVDGILDGVRLLAEELQIQIDNTGYIVRAIRRTGGIELDIQNDRAEIYYEKPCHFYRGLMLLIAQFLHRNCAPNRIYETPRIKRVGLMLDVSRNAVLTVESVKHFLRKMALMGMDLLMLYMEDIYYLKEYEYLGYMRGRYTDDEFKEIDDYAYLLGIEVMPYIQTLAHMGQILKWDDMKEFRDTEQIILVGDEKTYHFLDNMIGTVSSHFRSKRINIGMDEAHDLGLGAYLTRHGYRDKMNIIQEHLSRVLEITDKYNLTSMISSDMLFRNSGGAADHYEMGDETDCVIDLPDNLELLYWDYFRTDVEEIREFIRRHKVWGKTPIFLGTVPTWLSYSTNYSQSFANSSAALEACALEGVEEAVVSIWLHDGAENNLFAGLPGISYFAQQVYNHKATDSELREYFHVQTGASFDSFLLFGALDKIPGSDGNTVGGNPSKFLLWQDVLLGFLDFHICGIESNKHYQHLSELMGKAVSQMGPYQLLMENMRDLSNVLAQKSEIGIEIKNAYDKRDIKKLKVIAKDVLPKISNAIDKLRRTHRKTWMETLKPFGWEILDARYGGLCARLETTAQRLQEYATGIIPAIPELEEVRLPYKVAGKSLPIVLCYDQIVSSGYQNGPLR